jgi:hypothetical protein
MPRILERLNDQLVPLVGEDKAKIEWGLAHIFVPVPPEHYVLAIRGSFWKVEYYPEVAGIIQ